MRSNAFIVVTCDGCGEDVEIQLTALARSGSYDERNVSRQLKSMGWTNNGDEDYCESCSEERKSEEDE